MEYLSVDELNKLFESRDDKADDVDEFIESQKNLSTKQVNERDIHNVQRWLYDNKHTLEKRNFRETPAMCVSHLFQIARLIHYYCVKYARFMMALIISTYDTPGSEKKHDDQPQERKENQIPGTEAWNNMGFNLSNTAFGHSGEDFQQCKKIKTRNQNFSPRKLHARRHFNRMKQYIFFKKIKCLRQRKTILKSKPTHLIRSNYNFAHMNSFSSYPVHRRCSRSDSSSSSESDADMEQRIGEELPGVNPDFGEQSIGNIGNMGQLHESKIGGGAPIECNEDILYPFPVLEESQVHLEYREVSSGLTTNGRQMHVSDIRHIFDSQYIDLHPEIPVGGIQVDHDPLNAEFYEQAVNAFRAFLERVEASIQTNCIGRCWGIDHDLIYQEFLRDPDRNSVKEPIQVTDDNSTSGSGLDKAIGVNVPGTELEHAPTRNHSPFDDGMGTSGANQSSQIHVKDEEQCATGATLKEAISRPTMPIVLPHKCVFCGRQQVSIRFEPCQHAISCQECSVSKLKCPVCGKDIKQKIPV